MPETGIRRFGEALDEAAAWLDRRGGGAHVLAVDGHSAAGKSTFAEALGTRTGAAVVRGDDFYRVMREADRAALTPAAGVELYYDWQRMRDEVLLALRAGVSAEYQPYDWDTRRLASRVVRVPAAAVILEGLFVSRPELQPLVDRSILVDAPAIVRRQSKSSEETQPESGTSAGMLPSATSSATSVRHERSTSSFAKAEATGARDWSVRDPPRGQPSLEPSTARGLQSDPGNGRRPGHVEAPLDALSERLAPRRLADTPDLPFGD